MSFRIGASNNVSHPAVSSLCPEMSRRCMCVVRSINSLTRLPVQRAVPTEIEGLFFVESIQTVQVFEIGQKILGRLGSLWWCAYSSFSYVLYGFSVELNKRHKYATDNS